MPGRHAAKGRSRRVRRQGQVRGQDQARGRGRSKGLVVLVIVLAIVVAVGAFVGLREFRMSTIGQPDACGGSFRVRMSVAPEIAAPLQTIADRIAADKVPVDGACVTFEINRASSRDVFNRLSNEASQTSELWIPDTWEWVSRIGIPHDRLLSLSPSVAASPLVLATTQADAEAVRSQSGSWASLAPAGKMALADAEKSGVALNALLAIRRSLPDQPGVARDKLGTVILHLVKQRVDSLDVELDRAGRGDGLRHGVPATEQQVLSLHREHPQADVVPVAPRSGTVLLDYPLVAVLQGRPQAGRLIEAGAALMRYVDSAQGRAVLRKAGFRDYRDQVPPSDPDNVGSVEVLSPITLDDADDVLRSWAAMSLESRLLAVVDVSGSMVVPAGNRSRIELARDAARTAFSYFPDSSQVGLWEFSQNRDDPRGYLPLSPTAALSAAHRAELDEDLDGLPQQVGGGTALYDTFLAAYQAAQGGYDPGRANSLVLLTDACSAATNASACTNEVTPGITLDRLINLLEVDPARPISVVLVGIGPDADIGSLQRIADTVGGRAYRAKNADDMEGIIIDSLLRRQCGSTCT